MSKQYVKPFRIISRQYPIVYFHIQFFDMTLIIFQIQSDSYNSLRLCNMHYFIEIVLLLLGYLTE